MRRLFLFVSSFLFMNLFIQGIPHVCAGYLPCPSIRRDPLCKKVIINGTNVGKVVTCQNDSDCQNFIAKYPTAYSTTSYSENIYKCTKGKGFLNDITETDEHKTPAEVCYTDGKMKKENASCGDGKGICGNNLICDRNGKCVRPQAKMGCLINGESVNINGRLYKCLEHLLLPNGDYCDMYGKGCVAGDFCDEEEEYSKTEYTAGTVLYKCVPRRQEGESCKNSEQCRNVEYGYDISGGKDGNRYFYCVNNKCVGQIKYGESCSPAIKTVEGNTLGCTSDNECRNGVCRSIYCESTNEVLTTEEGGCRCGEADTKCPAGNVCGAYQKVKGDWVLALFTSNTTRTNNTLDTTTVYKCMTEEQYKTEALNAGCLVTTYSEGNVCQEWGIGKLKYACKCGEGTCAAGNYCYNPNGMSLPGDGICLNEAQMKEKAKDCIPNCYGDVPGKAGQVPEGFAMCNCYGTKCIMGELCRNGKCIGGSQCRPIRYWKNWKGSENCYFCGLFTVLFNACSQVALQADVALSKGVAPLLIVAFALWVAFTVLSFVSSTETKDGRDLIVSFVNQAFVVAFAFFILMGPGARGVYNLALEPIFNTGLYVAQASISDTAEKYKETNKAYAASFNAKNPIQTGMCEYDYGISEGGLPKSMGQNIVCMIDLLQQRIARVTSLGSSAICYSWEQRTFVIPVWSFLITGVLLWLSSMLMMLAYPFLMIDTVIQLAVAAGLMPVAIFLFCFKITRKYCKKVWDAFLNAMFNFIFLSIIVLLLCSALESTITTSTEQLSNMFHEYSDMLSLLQHLHWSGVNALKIVFVILLTWAVLPEVGTYASDFAGSLGKGGIGSKVGGTFGSAIKSGAMNLTRPLRQGAAKAIKQGASSLTSSALGAVRGATQSIKAKRYQKKAESQAISGGGTIKQNEDGTTTYTYQSKSWLRRRAKVKSVTVGGENGPRFEVRKQMGNGEERVRISTKSAVVRQRVGADGNVYRDKIKGKGALGRSMVNKENGKLSKEAMAQMIQELGGNEDAVAAVVRKMSSEQMKNQSPLARRRKEHITSRQVNTLRKEGKVTGYKVVEKYADGTMREYSIEFAENGRAMTKMKQVNASGKMMMLSTDGVVNQKTVGKADADGNLILRTAKTHSGLSAAYKNANKAEVAAAGSLFEEKELATAFKNEQKRKQVGDKSDVNLHEFG